MIRINPNLPHNPKRKETFYEFIDKCLGRLRYVLSNLFRSSGKPGRCCQSCRQDSRNIKTEPNDKVKKGECQTCAKRKYVDGSNEFNVSFKAPGHISPEDSAAKVMAHEQQHVANAVAEGSKPNKELISATGYRFTLPFVRNVAALMYPVETPILSFVQQAILPTLIQNCSSVWIEISLPDWILTRVHKILILEAKTMSKEIPYKIYLSENEMPTNGTMYVLIWKTNQLRS